MNMLQSFLMSFLFLLLTIITPVLLVGIVLVVGFTIKDMWDKLNSFFDF
jgi:Flp pilus assembly pilin Flp